MRLKSQILSVLNTNHDFLSVFTQKCNESKRNTDIAFSEIANTIIYSLNIQCILNGRTDEICMIAKECSQINFNANTLFDNPDVIMKGSGANSELMGDRFGGIVETIAELSGLKSRSVNKLFAILTPVVLSSLFFNYKANNYTHKQLIKFIEKLANINQPAPSIRNELNGLIRDEELRQVVNLYYPQGQGFFAKLLQNITDKWSFKPLWNLRH